MKQKQPRATWMRPAEQWCFTHGRPTAPVHTVLLIIFHRDVA